MGGVDFIVLILPLFIFIVFLSSLVCPLSVSICFLTFVFRKIREEMLVVVFNSVFFPLICLSFAFISAIVCVFSIDVGCFSSTSVSLSS